MSMKKWITEQNTIVFSSEKLHSIQSYFEDATVLLMFKDVIDPDQYESVSVPPENCRIELFYDKREKGLFLSNFILDQSVLDVPIDAVSVFAEDIQIFVHHKHFSLPKVYISEDYILADFYTELLRDALSTSSNQAQQNPRKRKRIYVEALNEIGSIDQSGSQELGIYSFSGSSSPPTTDSFFDTVRSCDSDIDDNLSVGVGRSDCGIPAASRIQSSKLDQKQLREMELMNIKKKIDSLFSETIVPAKELVIPTEKVCVENNIDASETTVKRMYSELSDRSSLQEPDPIVVVRKNEEFKVISGCRRVTAYKQKMTPKICVQQVEESDASKYLLNCFFRKQFTDDFKTFRLIQILKDLLLFLQLKPEELSTWTIAEKNTVFGNLFNHSPKLRVILDLIPFPRFVKLSAIA